MQGCWVHRAGLDLWVPKETQLLDLQDLQESPALQELQALVNLVLLDLLDPQVLQDLPVLLPDQESLLQAPPDHQDLLGLQEAL